MARLPRLTLAGQPHLVVQRGNNRQAVFTSPEDVERMLALLHESARDARVAVHAYVLLPAELQLLVTPEADRSVPLLMQAVGRRYVRWFNARHGRTGTLWEGRYRSTVLQAEPYLLPCMVHLDLEPVRAGLVDTPAAHVGSSHRHYAGLAPDRLVTPHPLVWQLGNTPFAREQAYVERVAAGLAPDVHAQIRAAAERGWALGDAAYLAGIEAATARRASPRRPGRPKTNVSPIFDQGSAETF